MKSRFVDDTAEIKAGVSCAVLLERSRPSWNLDICESTRVCLKYRRDSEIILVTHEGKGWWDPTRPAGDKDSTGDVFGLAQRLNPELNFGHARKLLRGLIGLTPTMNPEVAARAAKGPSVDPRERWQECRRPWSGSRTWRFLIEERGLPQSIVRRAVDADLLREGAYGSAWFAYRDHEGRLTGIEMHGSGFHAFSRGENTKSLFRLSGGPGPLRRIAATECAIDALSLAVIEGLRRDTLYLGTTGGMGPSAIACLRMLLREAAPLDGAVLVGGTDNDKPGDLHAAHLAQIAGEEGIFYERSKPPENVKDWNDVLRNRR